VKLAVITACFYPNDEYIHWLRDSAKRFGILLMMYGIGEDGDWIKFKVTRLLEEARKLKGEGYTHMLYVDGRDCIFLSDLGEVEWKYHAMHKPSVLFGWEPTGANAGCFIASLDFFLDRWQWMVDQHWPEGDDQVWINRTIEQGRMMGANVDNACRIFYVPNGECDVRNGRIRVGEECPVVAHFAGGYTDSQTGKDYRIAPVWERLFA
jgi:hypothetical protein